MSLFEDIKMNGFIVTELQMSQLGWQHVVASDTVKQSNDTYLSILIAMTQAGEALEVVYKRTLKAIQDGIAKAGYEGKALESKSAFARSAASTLRKALNNGADIADLVPGNTTKSMLQKMVVSAPKAQKASGALMANLKALAERDPDAALREAKRLMNALKAFRAQLRPRVVSHQLERQQPVAH